MRRVVLLVLLWMLLSAGAALGQDRSRGQLNLVSTPVYGQVIVLKDKSAGYYEDVRHKSLQVTLVRGGVESSMATGVTLHRGDTVRTREGTCVIKTPSGWTVEVAERSEVVLEPSLVQRIGEVFFAVQGFFSVRVNEVELLVEGTAFKVDSTADGNGTLLVSEGVVRIRGPSGRNALVSAGEQRGFDPTGPLGSTVLVTAAQRAVLDAWRAERFAHFGIGGTRRDQAHVRLRGGVSFLEGSSWGRVGLALDFRTAGPVWLGVGASLIGHELAGDEGVDQVVAVPVHAGVRLVFDLPRAFFVGAGAHFDLLFGQRCLDLVDCNRGLTAEPGAALSFAVGHLLSRRFGFDFEVLGGVGRRTLPTLTSDPEYRFGPRIHISMGLFLRL